MKLRLQGNKCLSALSSHWLRITSCFHISVNDSSHVETCRCSTVRSYTVSAHELRERAKSFHPPLHPSSPSYSSSYVSVAENFYISKYSFFKGSVFVISGFICVYIHRSQHVWVLFNDDVRGWDYMESGFNEWDVNMERWWKETAKRTLKDWASLFHCLLYTVDFT